MGNRFARGMSLYLNDVVKGYEMMARRIGFVNP